MSVLRYRDETRMGAVLSSFLEEDEELWSLGKAISHITGIHYYTGHTAKRVVFLRYIGNDHHVDSVPVGELERFLKKKRRELLPFASPFYTGRGALLKYDRLKEIATSYLEIDEKLITIARANTGFSHYLLVFSDKRIAAIRISRARLVAKQIFSPLSCDGVVSMDVPYDNRYKFFVLTFPDGESKLFGVTGISGFGGPGSSG